MSTYVIPLSLSDWSSYGGVIHFVALADFNIHCFICMFTETNSEDSTVHWSVYNLKIKNW